MLRRRMNFELKPDEYEAVVSHEQAVRIQHFKHRRTSPGKRALLSYLPVPAVDFLSGHLPVKFSNDGIAVALPIILADLGYSVDIISWDDNSFTFLQPYDLVVGHGARNFDALDSQMAADTPFVYFSTGSYWRFHNQREATRFAELQRRRGITLSPDRMIIEPEEAANRRAIGIVCLGNEDVARTYAGFKNVINVPIGCYPDDRRSARPGHDFLFFSGAGNVHKGLDRLLEAFAGLPEYRLHICTYLEEAFAEAYAAELALPNIVSHGFVELRSPEFYEIIAASGYVIFPSCSEGSPGSVVEGMLQGLIPIVSREAHLDVGSAGFVLDDVNVNTIKAAVRRAAGLHALSKRRRSAAARRIALTRHTPARFQSGLRDALTVILGSRP